MQNDWFIMLNGQKGYYVSWKILFFFFIDYFQAGGCFAFWALLIEIWPLPDKKYRSSVRISFYISREAILRTNIAYLHLVIIFSAGFPHEYYQHT